MDTVGKYEGPDECIDDSVARQYFDNDTVSPPL